MFQVIHHASNDPDFYHLIIQTNIQAIDFLERRIQETSIRKMYALSKWNSFNNEVTPPNTEFILTYNEKFHEKMSICLEITKILM